MPTVTKTFAFAADAEGLADAASTAAITFAHESADGSPSNGCVKFTSAGTVNATEYARRASTGQTWQTWGVPANGVVTSVQVSAIQRRVVSFSIGDSLSIKARVIGSAAASIHGTDLFSESFVAPIGWGAGTAGSVRAVDAGSQAASTDVRLELECAMNDGGLGNAFDLRLDTITLILTYDEAAPPSNYGFEMFEGSTGLQKYLPPIHACNFELLDKGGCGAGSADLQVEWENLDVDGTEFVDVTLFGERIYRGWVVVPARNVDTPETASLSLQGFREKLNHIIVRWKLAYGGDGADLATIAGDLITDFVVEAGWTITQDMDATGVTLKEFDARGMSVAQALDKLCTHAAENAIWGYTPGFTDTTPAHTIYFRPKPSDPGKYYVVGKDVTAFVYPPDTGAVVNVVNLTGGPVKQPNLCYNPSFEEVAPASETVGNLLNDYSFEDNDTAWTLTGSRKYTAQDATAVGTPKSGKYWLELDQNTEKGEQTVFAPYTVQYTGFAWIRRETSANATPCKLTLEGLDSGNSVIVTADTGFVTPVGVNWEKISVDLDPTAQSSVVKIRYRVETNTGTANNDGVLVDDVALIEKDGIGQIGWRRIIAGAAAVETFNWAFSANDLGSGQERLPHGGYVVHIDASGIAGASDYVEIRTTKDKRIEVQPNEVYTLLVAVGGSAVTFAMGVIEYDSADAVVATNVSDDQTHVVNYAVYAYYSTAATHGPGLNMSATTRSVDIFIRYRDTTSPPDEIWIDRVFFCQGAKPADISLTSNAITDYWTGDNYERRFRTDDALFTGGLALDADADASITTYGVREQDESNELVTDYDSATEWAQDYFNAFAVPTIMARLTLGNLASADELLYPTDNLVQVHNLNDAPDALNAVRIDYTIRGDVISMSAELGSEMPSYEQLFRIAQGRERGRVF